MRPKHAGLINAEFRYTPAAKTDIRKTFARIRRQMEQERQERDAKITMIPRKGEGKKG